MEAKRIRLARDFSRENLRLVLARHRECLSGAAGRVLKNDERTRVSAVDAMDGRRVIVKEYRAGRLGRRLEDLVRPAAALREWRAAQELARRGVPAPAAWALALAPPLSSESAFVVLEEIEGAEPVNRFALRHCAGTAGFALRRRLIDALAGWLRSLHAHGVEHRDLKGSNVLVRSAGDGFELFLVDLAAVRFRARVGEASRLEALAQLNASMPLVVRPVDRLRFLSRYAPDEGRVARARRFRAVDRLTRSRGCVWDPGYSGRELGDAPH